MIKNVNFRLFLYKNVTEEPSDPMSLKYRVMKTENGISEGRRGPRHITQKLYRRLLFRGGVRIFQIICDIAEDSSVIRCKESWILQII